MLLSVVLLSLVVRATAHAQVFISAPRVITGGDAGKPYFGDFNGDGHADMVMATFEGIKILLGSGDGTFQSSHQFGVSGNLAVGDFNRDRKLDVAVTGSGMITIYAGHGNGTFQTLGTVAANSPATLKPADMNGDGKLDLVFAIVSSQTQGIGVLLSNGDGTFQPELDAVFGRSAGDIQIGDFNADGKPDVVAVSGFTYSKNTIRVLLGNGDGTLQSPVESLVDRANTVAVADFDGDGHLDVVLDGSVTDVAIVMFGRGDGHLGNATSIPVGHGPRGVVAADFNGDAKADFAIVNATDNSVSVLLGLGTGTFQPRIDYAAGQSPSGISLGDINGDGRPDLATPLDVACCEPAAVAVLLNKGNGTLYASRMYETGLNDTSFVAAGDLNGDSIPDIVVAAISNSISVLTGFGDGSLGKPHLYPVSAFAESVAMGDFNNDGNLDVVVACASGSNPGAVDVLLGNGDGTLQPHMDTVVPHAPLWVVTGDLNRDGNLDVVVGESATWPTPGDMAVLLGNGDGTFNLLGTYNTGGQGDWPLPVIADVNADSKPDLLVAHGNKLAVLLGFGNGTFKNRIESSAGNSIFAVTTGDLDGDGNLDVISAGNTGGAGGSVGIMFGTGDGNFSPLTKYGSARGPHLPSVADFNLDGYLDIAATNAYGTISTWLNNGDGTLQPHVDYAVGSYPNQNAVADFNGDGYPDLVVANSGAAFTQTVTVLLNKGQ